MFRIRCCGTVPTRLPSWRRMLDHCLVAPTPSLVASAESFRGVVESIRAGDDSLTIRLLSLIDETGFRSYWTDGGMEWERRHRRAHHLPRAESPAARTIPSATRRLVVLRDGWTCRYCALPLLSTDLVLGLAKRFPSVFPWGSADLSKHASGLVLRYTPDHVVPRACGGNNEPDNLVASCGTCQYMKGDCTIEELGLFDPRDRPPALTDWDGGSGLLGRARF